MRGAKSALQNVQIHRPIFFLHSLDREPEINQDDFAG